MLGTPFMPHQRLIADVTGEYDPATGVPYYRSWLASLMRQAGKTTLILATEVDRCVSWDEPQRVAYSAQTGFAAATKLMADHVPVIERSPLGDLLTKKHGGRIRRAQGNWGLDFGGGGRLDIVGSSSSSGHGSVIDLALLDEVWDDKDDRREQALLPAMVTRPQAQMASVSTMGDDSSVYLNRLVDVGRQATVEDTGRGVAYFEYSFDADDDPYDPATWRKRMPHLGRTITEDAVAHAAQTMDADKFLRAFGNRRSKSAERIIPAAVWDAVQDPTASADEVATFALDVNRDATSSTIAVSDGDVVEVVEHGPGTAWAVKWFADRDYRRVVLDGRGPAASLVGELEACGLTVDALPTGKVASACFGFYVAVAESTVRVRPDQLLDDAVAGAARKAVGDRFTWSRSTSGHDVTPLMAASLARHAHEEAPEPGVRWIGG